MKTTMTLLALAAALTPWCVAQTGTATASTQSTQSADQDLDFTQVPAAITVSGNSATVSWGTSAQSSAVVKYGTDKANLSQTAESAWGGPQHQVTLNNLQPNTTYYFQVISGDAKGSGTGAMSAIQSFKTGAAGSAAVSAAGTNASASAAAGDFDLTQMPTATAVTDTSAVVSWATSAQSSAVVKYGTDKANLSQMSESGWGGPQHQVTLSKLQPNTTYYYQVISGDAKGSGTGALSPIQSFKTTAPATASADGNAATATASASNNDKIQAGPVPQAITNNSVTLWWVSTVDSNPTVKFGTNQSALNQTATANAGREHRAQLTGLQPSTTYYYQISENGQTTTGKFLTEDAKFAAQAVKLHITKGPVIEYLTKNSAIVAWSTNRQASTIVRFGTDPNNLSKTAEAPWGQETHRVTIRNLQANTKYYFLVESSQAQGTGAMAKSEPAPFQTIENGKQAMTTHEQH